MSFFAELKRRNVVRVGIAYVIIGWVLAQVAEFAFENFGAPEWVLKSFVVVLLLGLPLALFFAWAFEITPEGVKREKDVDRSQSITAQTGRKLDFIIIGVLVIAVVVLLVDEFLFDQAIPPVESSTETQTELPPAAVTDSAPSIAVLPFVNMSDDQDYFADGLSEELMNLLANIPDLKVAGRTSSFQFKGKTDDLREIGDALGVENVLEGSVRRSGDRLRVTAQLIKVDDGFHIWSETYDRTMADIFDIQDDVASSITRELELRLVPNSGRPTDNAQAYALYVEALPYIANNDQPDVLEIVIDLLDRALELDPGFAKAHEAKAVTYWMVSGTRLEGREAQILITESASRALELDESLVLARYYAASTSIPWIGWINEFNAVEAAISADPDNYNILRAWCNDLIHAGYFREALACADRTIDVEPLSPVSHWRAGISYGALGQRDDAHASFLRSAAGGSSEYAWELVFEAANAGRFDQAVDYASAAPDDYGWQPDDIRQVQQWIETDDDAAIMEWIEQMADGAADYNQRNSVYRWYLTLGKLDEFWAFIERTISEAGDSWANWGFLLDHGYTYREQGTLRHPGYLRYAEASGLFDLWEHRGAPDFCNKESGEWVCE